MDDYMDDLGINDVYEADYDPYYDDPMDATDVEDRW